MKHAEYCILNKRYPKDEYEKLAGQLVEHMIATGEWGQHFPSKYSPFGYNESVAYEYFPLTRAEAIAAGYSWSDTQDDFIASGSELSASDLSDSIKDVPDDIVTHSFRCEETGKPFRIIRQELQFYQKMQLSLPRLHPDERHRRRMALRNPRSLWKRVCSNCDAPIQTSYNPDRPEIVFCETCYQRAMGWRLQHRMRLLAIFGNLKTYQLKR